MSAPFLAEIRIFACNFAPTGWAFCDGQLLSISQNTALFALLGTTYGGDGRSTFALPDLRDNVPRGAGQGPGLSNVALGETSGSSFVTLLESEMPAHVHTPTALSTAATENDPTGALPALPTAPNFTAWGPGPGNVPMAGTSFSGGSQPHNNLQPSLVLNFCIALQGIFPQRP